MIECSYGFWGSIFGYIAFGDKLEVYEMVAMVVGYLGIGVILFGNGDVEEEGKFSNYKLGIFLSVL